MKESYWQAGSRAKTAKAMLAELYPRGQTRAKKFKPEESALLALDLQQFFLDPASHAFVPSGPIIVPVLKDLAMRFAAQERPVIFSQHSDDDENLGGMSAWWQDSITKDHPFRSLSAELDLSDGAVLIKSQYDAFYDTDLEKRLQDNDVRQVVIGGVMTHLCCETTARSAFVRGFDVFFLVDGTATYNRDFHMASLRNLGHGFATLATVSQVFRAFEGAL